MITVRFEEGSRERKFASSLQTQHVLNRDGELVMPGAETLLSPEDIVEEVGDRLMARIEQYLQSHPDLFVSAGPFG